MLYLAAIATLLVANAFAVSVPKMCPENWQYFEGDNSCIMAHTEGKSFSDARSVCQNEGGDLVVVNSQEKNDLVQAMLSSGGHIWIGVWDEHHNQQWANIDGSPLNYAPWNTNEPNNYHGKEACGHILGAGNKKGLWNDINCARSLSFVCGKSAAVPEPEPCPENWQYFAEDDSCLMAPSEEKSFSDARLACQNDGGDLVIVDSEAKNDFVQALVNSNKHIWIGVWDEHHNQQWTDIDGSALNYAPWNSGEPNNYKGKEACAHILGRGGKKGLWNDINCARSMRYVCEKPVKAPGCSDGWAMNEDGGVCIKVVNEVKLSFDDARKYCQAEGGDLVTEMDNKQNKDFVKDLLTRRVYYWVGLHDPDHDQVFTFVDGSTLEEWNAFRRRRGQPNNFRSALRRRRGQPNNFRTIQHFRKNQHCAEMKHGKWYGMRCGRRRNFVCQKDFH